jgi:protoheme IX farnesyltransferase
MRTDEASGLALRLTALAAAGTALLAVVSGALGAGTPHRVLAALALPPLLAVVVAAAAAHRRLLVPSLASLVLLVGAALVTARAAHIALAALDLAAGAVLAALTFRGARVQRGSLRDYMTLTKPRIMTLLLLTGACGMIVGARGVPAPGRLGLMLLGLALACGGASALNHVLDRDIDRLMGPRTASRPVAAGRLTAPRALEFGLALSACSFVVLGSTVNVLTATLALAGNLFYVVVYTGYLKRRGPGNIVLGGAAGAVPPLVGYAAATGNLALPALWLFLIVLLWTPPHFWSLALLLRDHYAAARVPMLPVVRGERVTLRRIVGYTLVLVAFTAVPFAAGSFGLVYLVAALVLGAGFLALTLWLRRAADARRAAFVFHSSLLYLALVFVAAALDAVV